MKKCVSIVLVFCLLLAAAACGASTSAPEKVVKTYIDSLKKGDFDAAAKCVKGAVDYPADVAGEMIHNTFPFISYTISGCEIDGDRAAVAADITNVDMNKLFMTLIPEVMEQEGAGASDEEVEAFVVRRSEELMNKPLAAKVTSSVEISLQRVEGKWYVVEDGALWDALTGGLYGMVMGGD